MSDLRNKYGEVVYRIEENRINDIYGNWKYEIRGEYIFDTFGNRIYEVRDEWLYDNSGNRLGQMKDLADLLPSPKDSGSSSSSNYGSGTQQSPKKPETGWEWFVFILSYFLRPFFELGYLNKYTATRGNYWRTLFCTYVYYLVGGMIIAQNVKSTAGTIIAIVVILILTLPIVFVSIRRMHDIGKSGWWNLIPVVGFFMCAFFPGKIENNPYV